MSDKQMLEFDQNFNFFLEIFVGVSVLYAHILIETVIFLEVS